MATSFIAGRLLDFPSPDSNFFPAIAACALVFFDELLAMSPVSYMAAPKMLIQNKSPVARYASAKNAGG
ncbi:MAG TPA: hypothetical protein VHK01_21855, partial [Lacipirellulaceae bacterium]|nr:hypothetical protein [Lacipirellulaceae bacterium]